MAIPFTVIGGFLGSGKTTLLNRILTQTNGTRFAVLVNDFGEINIDQSLIREHRGKTYALANGCICCSLANGFVKTMLDVMQKSELFEHIIVEASGVSDPQRIMDFARIDAELQPDAIIVLVDALNVENQLIDPLLTETITGQISSADMLLLNKLDLVENIDSLRHKLSKINPQAPILTSIFAQLPLDVILGQGDAMNAYTNITHANSVPSASFDHAVAFKTQSFVCSDVVNKDDFMAFINNLPGTLLRAKGIIQFVDGVYIWHQCGQQQQLTPYQPTMSANLSRNASRSNDETAEKIQSQIILITTADSENFEYITHALNRLFGMHRFSPLQ